MLVLAFALYALEYGTEGDSVDRVLSVHEE